MSVTWATEMAPTSVEFGTDTGNGQSESVKLKRRGLIPTAGNSPIVFPTKSRPDINSA